MSDKKPKSEYGKFENALKKILQVSHSELTMRIKEGRKPRKPRKQTS